MAKDDTNTGYHAAEERNAGMAKGDGNANLVKDRNNTAENENDIRLLSAWNELVAQLSRLKQMLQVTDLGSVYPEDLEAALSRVQEIQARIDKLPEVSSEVLLEELKQLASQAVSINQHCICLILLRLNAIQAELRELNRTKAWARNQGLDSLSCFLSSSGAFNSVI